jgi:hypothetical protein
MLSMRRNLYSYQIYGLIIKSEIEIPELCGYGEESTRCHVNISFGSAPRYINEPVFTTIWWQVSREEFYMHIKDVGYYYVSNGTSIIVEPEDGADMEYIKVFLLGSALGMLMFQRNIIAIHGGTIEIDGRGIILTGQTGAGKSTLNSAFRKEGYRFLSDDVSALGKDDIGEIVIHPAYPQAKLCADTMLKLGYNLNNFNLLVDRERDKYSIPLDGDFVGHNIRLGGIYEISVDDVEKVGIIEVLGGEKIKLILRNIYRIEIGGFLGFQRDYFKQCLEVAKKIPVYRLIRPRSKFTVNEQMELILKNLGCINNEEVISFVGRINDDEIIKIK